MPKLPNPEGTDVLPLTMIPALAQGVFDRQPHAALLLDADGRVLHANAAAAWLAADGVFPNFSELTGVGLNHSDDPTSSTPSWNRRLRVQAADGTSRQVDASLFAANDARGKDTVFCFLMRDATASVHAARGTTELESRSRVTSDSAPVLVWMARSDMARDWFNRSWLKFRGRTLGDELGEGWTQGVHPEDLERCLGIYQISFAEREPYTMDYRLQRHDGVYRHMLDTAIPRWSEDGEFLGYIGTCVDITDRKELEDKLAEHTRTLRLADRRREDFLAKLSHELRNPLGPIANAAAILRTLERGNRNLVMVREIIERQVGQLRRLITDLVDVTRITRGRVVLQREPVDIDTMIDSAVDAVRPDIQSRHHVLRITRPSARLSCDGDAQRLVQALSSLIANASKFSPDGSTILVSSQAVGDMVQISVRDPGRGIAPEFLPRVFELFVQGEQALAHADSGLGVGLTIAKRVAELHDGSVEVTSAGLGLGTIATLRLPLRAGVAPVPGESTDLGAVVGRKVLIIEDNADARESLRVLVELGGNEVRTAADAGEGLLIAESFAPDLVVCDIGLPDVDGYELVQALRDKLAGHATRFVALTGYGRAEDRDRALDSGFDSFLVKPLRPEGFMDSMSQALQFEESGYGTERHSVMRDTRPDRLEDPPGPERRGDTIPGDIDQRRR
jgi:PAS domain S-box-containing protein